MKTSLGGFCLAAAFCMLSSVANGAALTIVSVAPDKINCAFDPDCTFEIKTNTTKFVIPGATGHGELQTRVFAVKSGSPVTIKNGYEYRIDLAPMTTNVDSTCVTGIRIDFGPVLKLQYNAIGPLDDVFVIKGSGPAVTLASALQTGNSIDFQFALPVCAGDGVTSGKATLAFGLASSHALKPAVAMIESPGADPIQAKTAAPDH